MKLYWCTTTDTQWMWDKIWPVLPVQVGAYKQNQVESTKTLRKKYTAQFSKQFMALKNVKEQEKLETKQFFLIQKGNFYIHLYCTVNGGSIE